MVDLHEQDRCMVCGAAVDSDSPYRGRSKRGELRVCCSKECWDHTTGQELEMAVCDVCKASFQVHYAYQKAQGKERLWYFCSTQCREKATRKPVTATQTVPVPVPQAAPAPRDVRRVAVLNQKGGTGKTTTAVNLAAALAERGQRVLLVDLDGQGNVGVTLGIRGPRTSYHLLIDQLPLSDVAVPIRDNLDVVTSDQTLAAAEVRLAQMNQGRERRLVENLIEGGHDTEYDWVILDCAPSLSLLNQNALLYAQHLVIPVGCDYLSLAGCKQVLKTVQSINQTFSHNLNVLGVLPTFFDRRTKLSHKVLDELKGYFKGKVLPPINTSIRLRECPAFRKTIFEYSPESSGANDYLKVVDAILQRFGVRDAVQ